MCGFVQVTGLDSFVQVSCDIKVDPDNFTGSVQFLCVTEGDSAGQNNQFSFSVVPIRDLYYFSVAYDN